MILVWKRKRGQKKEQWKVKKSRHKVNPVKISIYSENKIEIKVLPSYEPIDI